MNNFPLRYIHGNILVGVGGQRVALYRVNPVSYPFYRDKKGWAGQLRLFCYDVKTDFSLYRVNRTYPAGRYVEQGMAMLDDRYNTEAKWQEYLEGQQQVLSDRRAYAPEVYIAVRLVTKSNDSFSEGLVRDIVRMRELSEESLGVGKLRPIMRYEIDALVEEEEQVFGRVKGRLPARRASTREIQWLFRRTAYRGVSEPPLDDNWKPNALMVETVSGEEAYEPLGTDVMRLGDTPVREQDGVLQVQAEDRVHYQAMLTLGALPDESFFPGESEYLFRPLEATRFSVDMVMHVEWISNRTAVAKVHKKIRDADSVVGDQEESTHGSLSWTPEEDAINARRLDRRLRRSDQPPMLRASVSFAVGAASPSELKKRVGELKGHFGTVQLQQPAGLQEALFFDHLPRADGGRVHSYRDWITPVQFATLMPIATHDLGSRDGAYIAHIVGGSERPICMDVTEAPRVSRASAMLFTGTQGAGKTTAAELVLIQAALRGSQCVDVDPKPDHRLEDVPELRGRVQIVDLDNPDEYVGLLDPLVILPPSRRVDGAMSYYMELLSGSPPTWGTAVRKAVVDVTDTDKQPCSNAVIERLMRRAAGEDANAAGDALATWASAGLAKFGFSNGLAQSVDQRQITTIRPSALSLPEANIARADYDEVEKLSVATLRLIANYAMRLINDDRSINKILLLDEAHLLLGTPSGRRLISDVNRQGRAKNSRLILVSQLVADPGEVSKLIGTVFAFGTETPDEARDVLELMGLDRNDNELAELVHSSRRGKCLIRDIYDYIAHAQIDVVFPHLLKALDTTPGARERYKPIEPYTGPNPRPMYLTERGA